MRFTSPGAFRLFLASVVVVHHASRLALGAGAVEVFFVLSGYWIATMWHSRYSRTAGPYLTFVTSRWLRLLPVFLACGAAIALLRLAYGAPLAAGLAPQLLILGYASLNPAPLVPAWSLDVEAQFYLVAPLLIWAVERWRMAALAVLLLVSGVAARTIGDHYLPTWVAFFGVGVAAASLSWRPSGRLAATSAGVALVLVLALLLSPWRGVLLGGASPGPLIAYNGWANAAVATALMPFAIFTTRQKGGARDGMFADMSYSVYLVHWVGLTWLGFVGAGSGVHRLLVTGVVLVGIYAASWLLWLLVDRPANRWRAAWVNSRASGGDPAAIAEPTAP